MDWFALTSAIATPTLAAIGTIWGHASGRRSGIKQADATIEKARTEARREVRADWESFTDRLTQRLAVVESRADVAEARLDAAESRTVAAEERAKKADTRYGIAIRYLRRLFAWGVERQTHDDPIPPPPPELIDEL